MHLSREDEYTCISYKQFSKKGCSDDGFNNYVGVHFDFEVNVEVGVDVDFEVNVGLNIYCLT